MWSQENEDVESRGNDEGDGENAEHVGVLEPVFCGRMGHALEADEGPGREECDAHDLLERVLVGNEGRLHRHTGAVMAQHGDDEAKRYPNGEEQRQHLHAAGRGLLALYAQKRDEADGEQCHQGFSQINLVAEYCVEVTELE